jgi:hypothetical protein
MVQFALRAFLMLTACVLVVHASTAITVLSDTIALCNAASALNSAELAYPATGPGSFTSAVVRFLSSPALPRSSTGQNVHTKHNAFIVAINTTAGDATVTSS